MGGLREFHVELSPVRAPSVDGTHSRGASLRARPMIRCPSSSGEFPVKLLRAGSSSRDSQRDDWSRYRDVTTRDVADLPIHFSRCVLRTFRVKRVLRGMTLSGPAVCRRTDSFPSARSGGQPGGVDSAQAPVHPVSQESMLGVCTLGTSSTPRRRQGFA